MEYIEYPYEAKVERLPWQMQGLQETRSGYGGRLTSPYKIKLPAPKIWRRVYAICYSNAGTLYIKGKDGNRYLHSPDLELALSKSA
jgi:hypothetical protein